MDYIVFKQWLQDEKKLSYRSASDVISRCKRINKLMQNDCIDEKTVSLLVEASDYDNMSAYIKSQLKRAVALYLEFDKKVK